MNLGDIIPQKREGQTCFTFGGQNADFTLHDFWSAAFSDLLSNMNRGVLAEYIVLKALKLADAVMNDYAEVDGVLPSGLKLEVKSSAFLQRWKQAKHSVIKFDIRKKKRFDYVTNDWAKEPPRRHSDIFVFCHFEAEDKDAAEPLNLDQWGFYVVATREIDAKKSEGKTIGLSELKRVFSPTRISFHEIPAAVSKLETAILEKR